MTLVTVAGIRVIEVAVGGGGWVTTGTGVTCRPCGPCTATKPTAMAAISNTAPEAWRPRRRRPRRRIAATGGASARSAWSATSSAIWRCSSSSCMTPLLLGFLQVGTQRRPGAQQAVLDRPGRQPELLGDLLHRQVGAVVQHQDLPVVKRQQLQAGLDREP